jgi:ectoine hydroxylase
VEVPWKNGLPASALQTSSVPIDEMKKVTAQAVIPA